VWWRCLKDLNSDDGEDDDSLQRGEYAHFIYTLLAPHR
jgi:hypothetical protein